MRERHFRADLDAEDAAWELYGIVFARHMASRLLAGGSSLKEVADVLRHRSLNTTLIYAKLDSGRLVEGKREGPQATGQGPVLVDGTPVVLEKPTGFLATGG